MENEGMENFKMNTAEQLMTALGYECLGRDPSQGDVILWMRSYGAQDLMVSLPEKCHADDVALALYEAACQDKQAEISGRWKAFMDAVRVPSVTETWLKARELQHRRREEAVAAASMPKEQPPTVRL
jgi:hypothetical protein